MAHSTETRSSNSSSFQLSDLLETDRIALEQSKSGRKLRRPEYEVQQFMKNFAQAVRDGNLEEILSYYSDDIEAFECPPPLAYHGIGDFSQNWKNHCTTEYEFPLIYEFHEERIFASETLASFSCLLHICGIRKKDDLGVESWLRMTCVLDKSEGYWQIVHDHVSVPITDEGQALMNLGPDDMLTH